MTTTPRIAQLDDVITSEMARWRVPGLSIGVLDGDDVEVSAYGIANIETGTPVVPETLFQVGSISKIFTTTLIMTLVDEGKIDLDTPVITYVPDLPLADVTARNSITVRHLLSHMSGFYGDRFDDQGRGSDAIAKAVAAFGDLPQQTAPGELWTYCNAGFDLAGRAAELVTGRGFEELMRERVYEPVGMPRATYFPDEAILHAVAVGHLNAPNAAGLTVAVPWPIPRRSNPAGGVSTNVAELLRFARMHIQDGVIDGKRVISAGAAQTMRSFQVKADAGREWGVGWSRRRIGEHTIVEHGGATNGFTARLTTIPEKRFALAIFTNHNSGGAAHSKISEAVLERLLGIVETQPQPIAVPDGELQRFAGVYGHQLAELTLTVRDGGFDVTRNNFNPFAKTQSVGEPFRLAPVGSDQYIASGGGVDDSLAEFIFNADGSVRFLRFGGRLAYPRSAS